MNDKRMIIVPAELARKIDDNRGDMNQAEFIDFLVENQLGLLHQQKKEVKNQQYATKEEVYLFEEDVRKLLKSFLEFFVNYGLELGKHAPGSEFEDLTSKLQGLQKDMGSDKEEKKATIKWK